MDGIAGKKGITEMITLRGKAVCRAIAQGVIVYINKKTEQVQCGHGEEPEKEILRYLDAVNRADEELHNLYEQWVSALGEQNAAVFQAQSMLLKDRGFTTSVQEMIRNEGVSAEYAVRCAGDSLAEVLAAVQDAYVRERAADIREVTDRVISILTRRTGEGEQVFPDVPFIAMTEDLTAGELMRMAKGKLCGLVLEKGSGQSHVAILAKGLGLPLVVQLEQGMDSRWNGMSAVLDGGEGMVYLEPNEETLALLRQKRTMAEEEQQRLQSLRGKENKTKDGRKIQIYANAGSLADVEAAMEQDAGGIGLLRSEFLYLERDSAPDEETQFLFYKKVLETMGGREVIIRTFDIGADKQLSYLKQEGEENPALGMRGIRLGLAFPELLKVQLRALFRAGVHGRLCIMYPMVATLAEVKKVKELERQVKQELEEEGICYARDVPVGIMIETPSAALLSDKLAAEVDFFSVGTNDLTQYTYAWDRQQGDSALVPDPEREAVFKLIGLAAENAHRAGIWIGVCGEMAANPAFAEKFLDMGIDELSVAPGSVLRMRGRIREL